MLRAPQRWQKWSNKDRFRLVDLGQSIHSRSHGTHRTDAFVHILANLARLVLSQQECLQGRLNLSSPVVVFARPRACKLGLISKNLPHLRYVIRRLVHQHSTSALARVRYHNVVLAELVQRRQVFCAQGKPSSILLTLGILMGQVGKVGLQLLLLLFSISWLCQERLQLAEVQFKFTEDFFLGHVP